MITDDLKNIYKYSEISKDIVEFLENLTPDTVQGQYKINKNVFANVDVYETKPVECCKFEAHEKYIDIQMLLEGNEQLDYICTKGLKISEQYDESRDVMFFENPVKKPDTLQLVPFKFALIYPHEAHRPQMLSGKSQTVKKVVVKILV